MGASAKMDEQIYYAQIVKDYLCKSVDNTPILIKEFAIKFEDLKKAKRAYHQAYLDFEKIHKTFFFHSDTENGDIPLFWEYPSPNPKQ